MQWIYYKAVTYEDMQNTSYIYDVVYKYYRMTYNAAFYYAHGKQPYRYQQLFPDAPFPPHIPEGYL